MGEMTSEEVPLLHKNKVLRRQTVRPFLGIRSSLCWVEMGRFESLSENHDMGGTIIVIEQTEDIGRDEKVY